MDTDEKLSILSSYQLFHPFELVIFLKQIKNKKFLQDLIKFATYRNIARRINPCTFIQVIHNIMFNNVQEVL